MNIYYPDYIKYIEEFPDGFYILTKSKNFLIAFVLTNNLTNKQDRTFLEKILKKPLLKSYNQRFLHRD